MPTNHTGTGLKRTVLSVALSLCIAGTVYAQSSTGSIFGQAEAGATVTIENIDTGSSRTITAGADGRFRLPQLQTGNYRVSSNGQVEQVAVRVGSGSQVNFGGGTDGDVQELGETVVTGVAASGIDVSSVESNTVFTKAEIDRLPVALDVSNVALLAPGTVQGDSGFGNLVSFGGASVAENGYYINGFDVTNIRKFISFATLPYDAIAEQQIKNGGYGAEYGRSLGGVISIVTQRGTNDFHFGGSAYWAPDALRGEYADSENAFGNRYGTYQSSDEFNELTYDAWGSGPIIKDKLFFFALAEGRGNEFDYYGREGSTKVSNNSPNAILKLDWNITDNHLLEFTGIWNKSEQSRKRYSNPSGQEYTGEHGTLSNEVTREYGGNVLIGKYTGYLTDSFTVSAMFGQLENTNNYDGESLPGYDCPSVYDTRDNTWRRRGCWASGQFTIRDPNFGPDLDKREAVRLDAEWVVGDHFIRFGYDAENFNSSHAGRQYSGGVYWRYFVASDGTQRVRRRIYETQSADFDVKNQAFYLEDNWQVTDNLMLYLGLRSEGFENLNGNGQTFVKADNLFAPRLGFSWDVNGDSSMKVFGNAGRYYIPIAANTNIRASGWEYFSEAFFNYESIDDRTWAPTGLVQVGETSVNGSRTPPNAQTVADTKLEPMYQDEFILGIQKEIAYGWTAGVKGVYRELKNGMEDYCSHQPFLDWARDNGHDNFDPDTMAGCFVLNPGRDVNIAMDLNNDGNLTEVTVPARYLGLPEVERYYRALELMLGYNGSDDWGFTGSYTWARSYGNYEGYVNSTLEQDDAGLVQDFDHARFEDGAYGYLPNDRRHTFKLNGFLNVTDEITLSSAAYLQSGRPVSCNGYLPLDGLGIDRGSLSLYGASSFYCLDENGNQMLTNRGQYGRTPWVGNLDLGISYRPNWADDKLLLKMDVFNALDSSQVTEYNETGVRRVQGELLPNPNFLLPTGYQSPRAVRFTVRYKW